MPTDKLESKAKDNTKLSPNEIPNPEPPGPHDPKFTFSLRSMKLEANGNPACDKAFWVALVMATGRYIVTPIAFAFVAWRVSDGSIAAPLLRNLSYILAASFGEHSPLAHVLYLISR